jgi:hypothetical protein
LLDRSRSSCLVPDRHCPSLRSVDNFRQSANACPLLALTAPHRVSVRLVVLYSGQNTLPTRATLETAPCDPVQRSPIVDQSSHFEPLPSHGRQPPQ